MTGREHAADSGVFNASLEHAGVGRRETFHQLESRPDLFIRRREIMHANTEYQKQSIEQFDLLRANGVKVPKFNVVIGEDNRGKAEFIVADRVEGETLDSMVLTNVTLPAEALNRTFRGIVTYLNKGQANDREVYWDFALRQFIYGHTDQDPQDDIYLVDIDPTFRTINGEILQRVVTMMQTLHRSSPIDDDTWIAMRELIITHDTSRSTPEDLKHTIAWLQDNLPPKSNDRD
jgi:hypothetical protein